MIVLARRLAPIVAATAVLVPLIGSPHSDSYPLSTYPMFAGDRGREARVATAVSIDAAGSESRLSPELIGGTDEVILAAATVGNAVARGESDTLCREIAERLSGSDQSTVVVRTERIDVVDHIAQGAPALEIFEHARCEVSR